MKIYGYSNNTSQEPMELSEVTFSGCPDALREVSEFLLKCAKEIESDKDNWEHKHFKLNNGQLIVHNSGDC